MGIGQWRRRKQQYTAAKKVFGGLAVLGGVYTVWQITAFVGGTILSVAWSVALPVAVVGGIAYGGKKIWDSVSRKPQWRR